MPTLGLQSPPSDQPGFYVTGGTLPPDANSYVARAADNDLISALVSGEYCYVLNSRQMGKSSLCVRTMQRLRAEGFRTCFLDLTKYGGRNVTAEQWYAALLADAGRELGLRAEFLEHWRIKAAEGIGPMQRFFGALTSVAFEAESSPLVVFVDEIDVTLSAPFSTDEFFSAIRQCFVGRATDAALRQITFCLLGTATPADLIQDERVSPFNIGKRIEVRDFSITESMPLAAGLGENGERLLARIMYWTNGHPYLTQRLCRACAEGVARSPQDVDRVCKELFLAHTAKEADDNLSFVRNRVLKGSDDLASLLTLYGKVRSGARVADDETIPHVATLKLSGVVKVQNGRLAVRNRIYSQVFDVKWAQAHLPDAEQQRQREAYRRGLLRSISVSSVIIAAMGALVMTANDQRRVATVAQDAEKSARHREEEVRNMLEERLFAADMSECQRLLLTGDLAGARKLLDMNRPGNAGPLIRTDKPQSIAPRYFRDERRGFEWRYLWGLSRGDETHTITSHTAAVRAVAFSPSGGQLASGGDDRKILLWNTGDYRKPLHILEAGEVVAALAFTSSSSRLAFGGGEGGIAIWDTRTGTPVKRLVPTAGPVSCVSFSEDGRWLASSHASGYVCIWDVESGRQLRALRAHSGRAAGALFLAGTTTVLSAGEDGSLRLWNDLGASPLTALDLHQPVACLAASRRGNRVVAGLADGTIVVLRARLFAIERLLHVHDTAVASVSLASDGSVLASSSVNSSLQLCGLESGDSWATLKGHTGPINAVCVAPDGHTLATAGGREADKVPEFPVKIWSSLTQNRSSTDIKMPSAIKQVDVAADSNTLICTGNGADLWLWDVRSSVLRTKLTTGEPIAATAISSDRTLLLTAGARGRISVWDPTVGKMVASTQCGASGITCAAVSATQKLAAVGTSSGDIYVWNLDGLKPLFHIRGRHKGGVYSVNFAPGESGAKLFAGMMLTSGADGTVKLWGLPGGQPNVLSELHVGFARWTSFAPNGRSIASTADDGFAETWDVASGSPGAPVLLRAISPRSGSFSTSGDSLAVVENRNQITLWNYRTQQRMLSLDAGPGTVSSISFAPDGTFLAASTGRDVVRLFRAPTLAEADRPQ